MRQSSRHSVSGRRRNKINKIFLAEKKKKSNNFFQVFVLVGIRAMIMMIIKRVQAICRLRRNKYLLFFTDKIKNKFFIKKAKNKYFREYCDWRSFKKRIAEFRKNKPKELVLPLYFGWQIRIAIERISDISQHIVGPFKKYRHYMAAVVILIIAVTTVIFFNQSKNAPTLAATYNFVQTSWSGGASSTAKAIHPDNQTGWNYFAASTNIITGLNLRISSSTYSFTDGGATSTTSSLASGGDFTAGTKATTTIDGSGSSASVRLLPQPHINEYTIGKLADITAAVSDVSDNSSGGWVISFSNTPNLSRIFKNDKFTDASSNAWKILSVSDSADKIIVIDSETNSPTAPVVGSGAVGRWFSTFQAWEDARDGDLVARNAIEKGVAYNDGVFTAGVLIDGSTTDADHYMWLTVAPGERHNGVAGAGVKIDDSTGITEYYGGATIDVIDKFTKIEWLEITDSSGGTGLSYGVRSRDDDADGSIYSNLLIHDMGDGDSNSGAFTSWDLGSGATEYLRNWIVYNIRGDCIQLVQAAYLDNITMYNCEYNGIDEFLNLGVKVARNVISMGNAGSDFKNISWGASSSNNISSDSTAPGANSLTNQTFAQTSFISTTTPINLHLEFNSVAKDAGVDLSSDFTNDIDGGTRSGAWDVGADDIGAVLVEVHSIGTNGRDFATLQGWEDARQGTTTTRHIFKTASSTQTGAFTAGETITGGVSGATGIYIKERDTPAAAEEYMTLDNVNGAFVAGETMTGGTSLSSVTMNAILTASGTVEKGEAYNDSVFTAGVTIDGSITDSTHYMWLTVEPGSRHTGVAGTGARVAAKLAVQDEYTIVEWFEVDMTGISDNGIQGNSDSAGSTIRNNLIYKTEKTNAGISGFDQGLSSFYNNVIYGFEYGFYNTNTGGTNGIYNNTVFNNTTGYYRAGGSPLLQNNIIVGNTTDFDVNGGSWDASSDYNLSSDATAPGSNSITSQATSSWAFVSVAPDFIDLHIMRDSAANNTGTSSPSTTFTTDIDRQSRSATTLNSTWDIGADEWHSSSPFYYSSGTFESATIDMGLPVNFNNIIWNPIEQNADTEIITRVAANNNNSVWNFIDVNQNAHPSGVTVVERLIRENCAGYSNCYTSLSAWAAAEQKDLVAANEIAVAKIDGPWANPDGAVSISGWTTGPNNYIRIYTTPAARHNGVWDNTKYRIEAANGSAISAQVKDIRIDGLQLYITASAWDASGVYNKLVPGNIDLRVSNSIIRGITNSTDDWFHGIKVCSSVGKAYLYNNIIYDFKSSANAAGINICGSYGNSSVTAYLYNNTIYDTKYGIFVQSGGSLAVIAKNNLSYNNTDNYYGVFSSLSTNNLSGPSQTDAPGLNPVNAATVIFTDESNDDFHLSSSDTAAKDVGASIINDSNFPFDNDIDGKLRPYGSGWDIGADEQGAVDSGVVASLDNNRYFRYQTFFSTANTDYTPKVNDVTLNYNQYATTSELISSPYNTNDAANLFAGFTWTESATSSTETIKLQIRAAANSSALSSASWCGPSDCSGTDYFTVSSGETVTNPDLLDGTGNQWLQYRVIMTSAGAATPALSDLTMIYVVNVPPEMQNLSASQQSDGTVAISYEVMDPDTDTGTFTPGYITPSFEYSTDNGASWTTITSGLSSGATSTKSVATSTWSSYSLTWNAKTILDGTYSTTTIIRITADDSEAANNTAVSSTTAFTLDVKDPVLGGVPVKVMATTTPATLAFSVADDAALQMMVGLESDLSGSSYENYNSTSTIALASDPDTVYVRFKDAFSNTTAIQSATTPETPLAMMVQDTSNMNTSPVEYRLFTAWQVVSAPAPGFFKYNVSRSLTTNSSDYSMITAIPSSATNYYGDSSVNFDVNYYYKTAVEDSDGNVSYFSGVVNGKANGAQDAGEGGGGSETTPPVITDVIASAATTQSITITWTTNELSNSTVGYSVAPAVDYAAEQSVASYLTNHSVILTNLAPGIVYNYKVISTDPSLNTASSTGYSFTTNSGPSISDVSIINTSNNSAEITWNTNVNASGYAVYATSTPPSGNETGSDTLSTARTANLTGLSLGTKYYFYVKSQDGDGNWAYDYNDVGGIRKYYTFTTASDAVAPIISSVSAISIADTTAVIQWSTNEPATSQVEYGATSGGYVSISALKTDYDVNHFVTLSGLAAKTAYYYRVGSLDQSGNTASSSEYSFITLETLSEESAVRAREATAVRTSGGGGILIIDKTDKIGPVISGIKISAVKSDSAAVSWITNEKANSFVEYGIDANYGRILGDYNYKSSHSMDIKNLTPETVYYYRVLGNDTYGNLSVSPAQTFTTFSFMKELSQEKSGNTASDARSRILNKKTKTNPFDMARQAIKKAWEIIKKSSSSVSITTLESTLTSQQSIINKLSKTIPSPLMSGEPRVAVTATSTMIEWKTDKKSNSLIALADQGSYNPRAANPYRETRGNSTETVTNHTVIIYDLKPDTVYHYQIRSKAPVGSASKSEDFTFKTISETIKITKYGIDRISTEKAAFVWDTSVKANSKLRYIPYRGNVLAVDEAKTITDGTMAVTHKASVSDFEAGVLYDIELSGADKQGNIATRQIKAFSTAKDNLPPSITQVRTDSAISIGKITKVQTIISWITNEPSTSRVYYQKGFSKKGKLPEKTTKLDKNYTKKHVAVITRFDPGTVYQFKVESADSNGNLSLSRTYTVFTPRQKETVFQVIMKNIEEVFGWMGEIR